MRKTLPLFNMALCFVILLSGCTPVCQDVRNQIKPGLSYPEVAEIMGTAGEIVEGRENSYQWYIEDFVRIIMDFTAQDSAIDPEQMILFQYEIRPGCSFIKKGMRYEQVVRLLGPPYKRDGCWKIHNTLFLITELIPPDTNDAIEDIHNINNWLVKEIYFYATDESQIGSMG